MGHYLDTGYGVVADRTKALAYFRQAALNGFQTECGCTLIASLSSGEQS